MPPPKKNQKSNLYKLSAYDVYKYTTCNIPYPTTYSSISKERSSSARNSRAVVSLLRTTYLVTRGSSQLLHRKKVCMQSSAAIRVRCGTEYANAFSGNPQLGDLSAFHMFFTWYMFSCKHSCCCCCCCCCTTKREGESSARKINGMEKTTN